MTGRQKIEAAFSREGTGEIPVVICHEAIFIRNHTSELVPDLQKFQGLSELESQVLWQSDVIEKINQDWWRLLTYPSVLSKNRSVESGQPVESQNDPDSYTDSESFHPDHLAETMEEIDELIPIPSISPGDEAMESGGSETASRLIRKFGDKMYPTSYAVSPLCACYSLWGFEGMMTMIADKPDMVRYACERYLQLSIRDVQVADLLGARGIWIDEYFTDIISSDSFQSLNIPYMRRLIEEIRTLGLQSIYYFCGNPAGRLEQIISTGSDALAFEEGKKGFSNDIDDIVDAVRGRCAVLGNLDSIGILHDGTEEQLRAEIKRQMAEGRRNGGRFIMSTGSPVTPATSVERVQLYCDMAREIGGI